MFLSEEAFPQSEFHPLFAMRRREDCAPEWEILLSDIQQNGR